MEKHYNHFRWLVGIGMSIGLFGLTLWIGGTLGVQPVNAQAQQTQQPQTITGTGTITVDPIPLTITFAPAGGPVTGSAFIQGNIAGGTKCTGTLSVTMIGSFAGGDGGAASGTFTWEVKADNADCSVFSGTSRGSWNGHFYANGAGSGITHAEDGPWSGLEGPWQVTYSPEEFQAALSTPIPGDGGDEIPTETPEVAGTSCSPTVRGLSPSKPGDVISPGASYSDANGNAVGIIQERWFLNGVNTTSIVWDGKQVKVELQYTCLDHIGYSREFTIPAYQVIPGPDTTQPSPPSGLPGAVEIAIGIGAIIIGIAGVTGVAGIAISQVIQGQPITPPAQPPTAPAPPIQVAPPAQPPIAPAPPIQVAPPVQPPIAPTPPIQVAPPVQPPTAPTPPIQVEPPVQPPATPEPGEQPQPPKKKLTTGEKARLIERRGQMESEVDRLRDQWKQTRDAVDKLSRLKKKNLIKFIFKKGIEVNDWIMTSPAEVINKVIIDPAMEKLLGKHDTSQDGNIIVGINNRIQSLKAEMHRMADEVTHLRNEIAKTNQILAEGGE